MIIDELQNLVKTNIMPVYENANTRQFRVVVCQTGIWRVLLRGRQGV